MGRIELNHWFVGEDELSIALMHFFIKIIIYQNDSSLCYQLEVYDDSKLSLIFNFYSLSDAVEFTEKTINICNSLEDISQSYVELFQDESHKKKLLKETQSIIIK